MSDRLHDARQALRHFDQAGANVVPIGSGLINLTYRVDCADGSRFVLQRVNDIFPPAIHDDIDMVTAHLERKGHVTPRLLRSTKGPTSGKLYTEVSGGVWRLMTWIDGDSRDFLDDPAQARSAGALLGRFHRDLADLNHTFANPRLGVHDTARHLQALRDALEAHRDHRDYPAVDELAREILAAAESLPPLPGTPDRIVHGDPKISNLLFADSDALCLIDLDTLTLMPLPLEMGDALRSWCNPGGEDEGRSAFDIALLAAAVEGYGSMTRDWIDREEREAFLTATETILIELAARFCADALNESYFGWNPRRFATRGEHNRIRARSQLTVAASLRSQWSAAEAVIAAAFSPS